MPRLALLNNWLKKQWPDTPYSLEIASADASFRQYYRAILADTSYIIMDAPPEHEDCRPFVQVAKLFEAAGAHVPHIYAENLEDGFLILSDLGNTTYAQELNDATAKTLYLDAIDALIRIQSASKTGILPAYDEALLHRELQLFPDWYIAKHLQKMLSPQQEKDLSTCFSLIIANNLAQPQVFVHRDYHCRNLMITQPNPGVIDFQDAVYGPITYDLVSLFKDAYIEWDEERILDWTIRYWERARKAGLPVHHDFADFYRDFEWMGVQRHIKVLGIFARLYHRDGKAGYLNNMPLVMKYLKKTCKRYGELHPLYNLLNTLEETPIEAGYTF